MADKVANLNTSNSSRTNDDLVQASGEGHQATSLSDKKEAVSTGLAV